MKFRYLLLIFAAFLIAACQPDKEQMLQIEMDPMALTISADGTAVQISLKTNSSSWTASGTESWMHVSPEKGASDAVLSVSADPNTSTSAREAKLVVTDGASAAAYRVNVTQLGKEYSDDDDPDDPDDEEEVPDDNPTDPDDPDVPQVTTTQPGWAELPKMNIGHSQQYLINTENEDQYYAMHICPNFYYGSTQRKARNYTVCFDAARHVPLWVAAPRHAGYEKGSGRSGYSHDPDIPSGVQYNSKSTGGGCNKGHMLGSAERTVTDAVNKQVFYYTNIAPQLSSGFNTGGGGWNTLEDWVDTQVCSDTLYVVIGTYYDEYTDGYGKTASPKTIDFGGRSDVAFPTMFYYVLLRKKTVNNSKYIGDCTASELKCAAFVRAHVNSLKGQDVTKKDLMKVSDLEKLTGVTYFANVPNAPKDVCEASDWGL